MKRCLIVIMSSCFVISGCGQKAQEPAAPNFEGIWSYLAVGNGGAPFPAWITVFENGLVYNGVHDGGYLNFDIEKTMEEEHRERWGNYSVSDETCIIKFFSGASQTLRLINKNKVSVGVGAELNTAYRSPNLDGLRIEGSWSFYADEGGYRSYIKTKNNMKPLIKFYRNGSFDDLGQFDNMNFGKLYSLTHKKGDGTYEIKNNTLTLNYNNDEALRFSFLVRMFNDSGSVNNDTVGSIVLNRTTLYRITWPE